MTERAKHPFRAVVGYDFSTQSNMALKRAVWLMSGFDAAEIHIVAAIDKRHHDAKAPNVSSTFEGAEEIRSRALHEAEAMMSDFRPRSIQLFVHTRIGNAANAILEVAGEVHADMLLVGTHSKKRVARLFLGSISERVIRGASCPVLVVRETHYDEESPGVSPEPACKNCLKTRRETTGEKWWCEFHDHAPLHESPLTSAHRFQPEGSQVFAWPYHR